MLAIVMLMSALVVLVPVLMSVSRSLTPGRAGTSFMPHFGQRSGASLVTSGCIGQT